MNSKLMGVNRLGLAAAVIAIAGLACAATAQQGVRRGGGNRENKPAPAAQPASPPRPAAAPRPAAPAPAPKQDARPAPRPAAPAPAPKQDVRPAPRPAAPAPAPKQDARPAPRPAAPAPKQEARPAPRPAAPAPAPKQEARPAPRPAAPAPKQDVRPAPRPAAPAPAPKQDARPAPRPAAPAPAPKQDARPAPRPAAPAPAPKQDVRPAPRPAAPAPAPKQDVRPAPPKSTPPVVVLPKPQRPKPTPPVTISPAPATPKAEPKAPPPARIVSKPSGGLVRPAAAAPKPVPAPARTPAAHTPLAAGGAIVAPAIGSGALTFDSGLSRSGGLIRDHRAHERWDDDDRWNRRHRGYGWHGGYGHYDPYCPPHVVSHYGYGDYPWRTTTYVSYSSGWCAPRPCYPAWPYTSSPFYGSPLRGVSVTYTHGYPCGPIYRSYSYCPTTTVVYPAPIYGHRPAWGSHYGFSWNSWGSHSSFSFGLGWGTTSCTTWRDPCVTTTWCGPRYSPRVYNRCAPSYGWWCKPVWGWTVYSGSTLSSVAPVADYSTPPVTWTATPVNAVAEFEDSVYSTMRGEYQTAIRTMRNAVLGAPEYFAPGSTVLDESQLQRAAWAMTVYRNPPQRAVSATDAAFMVAALAALSGDGAAAAQAADEARQQGDRHPATDRLIQMIEWAQSGTE